MITFNFGDSQNVKNLGIGSAGNGKYWGYY